VLDTIRPDVEAVAQVYAGRGATPAATHAISQREAR
jgi:hypothetical protein